MTNLTERQRAISELWRRGELTYKLHSGQTDLHRLVETLKRGGHKLGAGRAARRIGKTFFLSEFASSECIKNPRVSIPFGTTTIKAVKQIVLPIFHEILKDCPRQLRPRFNRQDSVFEFPNGSTIPLFGTDAGHAEKLRGGRFRHAILDEAGFMDDLEYIVNDILTPALMYDNGFILAFSTPPPTMDHYFIQMLSGCEAKGTSIHKTIWDNPMLKPQEILEFAQALGCEIDWAGFGSAKPQNGNHWAAQFILKKSITFRRECEAEIIADPERKIIPEFDEARCHQIVVERKRPKFCLKYTIVDTGFIDRTAVTYGYWDFDRAKAYVEDDDCIDFRKEEMTTRRLCEHILAKENLLWGDERPHMRFADGDLIVLNECNVYGLPLSPVQKDELEAQVNQVRLDIMGGQLEIHPRARNTIANLMFGIWNKRRTQFERTENFGHFDNLAALIYFLRHVNRQANPYPVGYNINAYNQYVPEGMLEDRSAAELKKLIYHKRGL